MGVEVVNEPSKDPEKPAVSEQVTISANVKATVAGKLSAGYQRDQDPRIVVVPEKDVLADEVIPVVHSLTYAKEVSGSYSLWATFDGTDQDLAAQPLQLAAPGGDEPPADEPPAEEPPGADIQGLVWDPQFAESTAIVGFLLVAAVAVVSTVAALHLVSKKMQPDDVAGVVSLMGVLLAAVAVVGGAWIVAMEMRGRASVAKGGEGTPIVQSKGALSDKAVEAVAKVVEALGKLRSPIALLAAGVAIFVASAITAGAVADDTPTDSTTTTTVAGAAETPTTVAATAAGDEPAAPTTVGG